MADRHFLIVEARFYDDIADMLLEGAKEALEQEGISYEVVNVPGALEIPAVIRYGTQRNIGDQFDAYVALGCVIRGETSHYDIVAGESARGIMDLTFQDGIPIGNGIITCENREQAVVRADLSQKNKGAGAAMAALELLKIKESFGVL